MSNRGSVIDVTSAILYLTIFVAFLYGYVSNIIKLFGAVGADRTAEVIVRLVGFFAAPLGAIAGYF